MFFIFSNFIINLLQMSTNKVIITFILLSFFLKSCSSDDGESEMEIAPVVGIWNLTEANISIAQDSNEDGTASTNMVTELPCLSGVLTIDASGVWSATLTDLNISSVTGDFYVLTCGETLNYSGRYSYQNSQLTLDSPSFSRFSLSGTTLTETIGEELPGVLSYKYQKQ